MEKNKTIEFIKNEVKDVLKANNFPLYLKILFPNFI